MRHLLVIASSVGMVNAKQQFKGLGKAKGKDQPKAKGKGSSADSSSGMKAKKGGIGTSSPPKKASSKASPPSQKASPKKAATPKKVAAPKKASSSPTPPKPLEKHPKHYIMTAKCAHSRGYDAAKRTALAEGLSHVKALKKAREAGKAAKEEFLANQ